ncbi:enterochelin esterase domain-containing protein [Cupriavidus malaysiensis]|uniref:enterochelin esterase domain-containing protein n=1 Tax=Cupriavidus malaysiensis TaxID=367825 RepID=UPI000A4E4E69|nr:enterochelin esterase domain-containing protein [Cupriavidus malaysiensis]
MRRLSRLRAHAAHAAHAVSAAMLLAAGLPPATASTAATAATADTPDAAPAQASAATPRALPGQPLRLATAQQAPATATLALQAGDFVEGTLDGPAATLDLLDAQGRHLRRLVAADGLSRGFLFVAPNDADYLLRVQPADRSAAAAPHVLTIAPPVPRARQRAPGTPLESPRLRRLARDLAEGGGSEAFWHEMAARGTPLVEALADTASPAQTSTGGPAEVLVTFLWRGAAHGVRLLGSPAGDHDPLARLGDSDVWYRSYRVPAGTRLSYQLAPDVPELDAPAAQRRRAILATARRDPLNPQAFPALPPDAPDAYAQKSVLELPGAPPQPWLARRPGVPAGTVQRHRLASRLLGDTREVYVYRPAPGAAAGQRQAPRGARAAALLVLFDAHAYLSTVPTPVILDNLVHDGLLPPMPALILANPSAQARATDLPPRPAFADFLAEELLPWAAAQGVAAPAARTIVAGSSYGGLAAAYAALRHPQRFGLVLSQSGSFWWAPGAAPGTGPAAGDAAPEWLTRRYAASPRLPLRFYLEAGRFEDGRGPTGILTTTRHLRDVLRARGYPVRHAEFASGHDYLQWRGTLACGLMALAGTAKAQRELAGDGEVARACPMS